MWQWLRRRRQQPPLADPVAVVVSYESPAAPEVVTSFLTRVCPPDRRVAWLCIGTDDCMGDAFGPYVGTLLRRMGVPDVWGTLEHPVHAETVEAVARSLPGDAYVIAIDAMLSARRFPPGSLLLNPQAIRPGEGVNVSLPPVGHAHIGGITARNQEELIRCPLGRIIGMSEMLANAIYQWHRRR